MTPYAGPNYGWHFPLHKFFYASLLLITIIIGLAFYFFIAWPPTKKCDDRFCVSFDRLDFVTVKDGVPYQSTATVKLLGFEVDGVSRPPEGPITWKITGLKNPAEGWWLRDASATHGLEWGPDFASTTPETPTVILNDPAPGYEGNEVQLTDIVGSRSVMLEASASIEGRDYRQNVEATFGPGPLSVFAGPPKDGLKWTLFKGAILTDGRLDDAIEGDSGFNSPLNKFPAAEFCDGRIDNELIKVKAIGTEKFALSFSSHFKSKCGNEFSSNDDYAFFCNAYSKLPSNRQLVAISKYDFFKNKSGDDIIYLLHNEKIMRKGAASAAGWRDDILYWSNIISFRKILSPIFRADDVNIATGGQIMAGGNDDDARMTVCLK